MTAANVGDPAVRAVEIFRVDGWRAERLEDRVAVECPLEVRLGGEPFSVIMRTPGDDQRLVLGFLFTEQVIRGADDVVHLDVDTAANAVDVVLKSSLSGSGPTAPPPARRTVTSSSCGMCGRPTLASLDVEGQHFPLDWTVPDSVVSSLPETLRGAQSAFAETGGLHAAGLFDVNGRLLASAEDVGRHNAVDKLLGRMLAESRLPLDRTLLCVSGRSSFEIAQKAWMAGIRLVAAVSAPSTLAIDLARDCGMTLLGFVRGGRFNVYAHDARLVRSAQ